MIDEKKLIKELEDMIGMYPMCYLRKRNELNVYLDAILRTLSAVKRQPKVGEWIPVEEGLPKEYETIFAKYKGTKKWNASMFEKVSDKVNVAIQYEDGKIRSSTSYTIDGKWEIENEGYMINAKVIAWMPLPEPYVKGEDEQ